MQGLLSGCSDRLLIAVAFHCRAQVLGALWFQYGGPGFVAPQHVGSSLTRIKPVFPALVDGFLTTG